MDALRDTHGWKGWPVAVVFAVVAVWASSSGAQTRRGRVVAEIDDTARAPVRGTRPPAARPENDAGRLPPGTALRGMTMVLARTAAQEAELEALIAAQQDGSSPLHQAWLTPEEFGARFGIADSDLAAVQDWLRQRGFSVDGVSNGGSRITFSGTAAQVEAAFGAEMHLYDVNGERHFAPSADVTVPAALAPVVQSVRNLSSFRLRPRLRATPDFTSSQTGSHFLSPRDVATIYDIQPAHDAGLDGAGQAIAVVGQSSIALTDIENFQSAACLAKKDPVKVLVPNTGTETVVSGDEAESDLDVEYTGAIAPGATIYFVFTGNSPNAGVFDALAHAVDYAIAPVISMSYGACEPILTSSDYSTLNGILAQAAAQGQSVVVASGDDGSTDCYAQTGATTAQQQALAVDFPASSQYVTAIGGTEFSAADVAPTNTTYWEAASGADVIASALSYIPEQVWNDSAASGVTGLAAGGGGISILTPMPAWQSSFPGMPSGTHRMVPDVSLAASPLNAPYLYCSSDTSSTKVTGSCSHGFRDASNANLTTAGGTSFGAPVFAGMLAIINQKVGTSGQGVASSTLYALAQTHYATAFHDTTAGGNQCTAGPTVCSSSGASAYAAGTGYDPASGLGSVDLEALLAVWPATTSSRIATTTHLSAATTTPSSGRNDVITIVVAPASGSGTPTGSVRVAVDGNLTATTTIALSGGSATYTFASSTLGTHSISAVYSGDTNYAPSTGSLGLTVLGAPGFALRATDVIVVAGSSEATTLTITPQNAYTGSIHWSVSAQPAIANACFAVTDTTVSGVEVVTATMTIHTRASACGSSPMIAASSRDGGVTLAGMAAPLRRPLRAGLLAAALLSLALAGIRRRGRAALAALALASVMGAWSCGSDPLQSAKGAYILTVVGTDTATPAVTASTRLTLTVR